uniref:CCDC144C-like coiled-coil domain-containing protein n=1 Tax=Monopterus albus TaxID=43700 RepID=A0A3Q3QV71_MONAL
MKKIFSFTKKKKHTSGTPDSGSVLSLGYELKEKDLGKIHKAASVGDLAKLKQLAKKNDINQRDKENRTALHIACASGHAEIVQFLVECKAELNLYDNQNRSALMKGVQGQHERCVSILLENHAAPNLTDINGNTALHLAANIPSISTAFLLLGHGAEINAQNKEGFSPLIVAVREDHIDMAEFLLQEGANVDCMDQDQKSPLMIAAGSGQIGMLRLLLKFDADITLKDTSGRSADDYAVMNGHHPCSLLIIEHGTQRKDGPSLSHQGPSKNKKKMLLGSPSQDSEVGFSLGGPATEKDADFEENSQSDSLSRVSKSAVDEWPSSENDDFIEKNPQKVNLRKMIASKKGEASALPDRSLNALHHPVDPRPSSFVSTPSQMTSTPLLSYEKKEDSTEDEPDDDKKEVRDEEEEGDISEENDELEESGDSLDAMSPARETAVPKDKKRDFLSELGLEKEEEQQDSWESESQSESPKMPHEDKQSFQSQNLEEMSNVEEEIKEIVNKGNDDKADTVQKETEKAKWEPLSVLSKLEGDNDPKADLMEELGLGDVDDLEDASDWDSASTTSKRILPGRRMSSPQLEEFPEISSPSVKEQDKDAAPAAHLTPQTLSSTPSHLGSHPQPRVRKLLLHKPESEKESDWEPDSLTSSGNTVKTDSLPQFQAVVKPVSPELSSMSRDTKSNIESDEQQQKVGKGMTKTVIEVQKSSASWDTGGTLRGELGTEIPETRSGRLSSQVRAVHQEEQPTATKSTNAALLQLHLPLQQTYNSNKQEKKAAEETLQLELVRGAQHSRAPQTKTHSNGDPLSVFDDSSLSEVSDNEGRLASRGQQKNENPEEVDMAEDFDELTQSSDTATDDTDSPTSGYRHVSTLIQKLDSATLDSRSMVKLQNIFHEYERTIQKEKSRHGYLADKLKQEQENRCNATMMYNTTKDKLRRTEELHQVEVQERQKVELTLRNLELEMRTVVNNMKLVVQLELVFLFKLNVQSCWYAVCTALLLAYILLTFGVTVLKLVCCLHCIAVGLYFTNFWCDCFKVKLTWLC